MRQIKLLASLAALVGLSGQSPPTTHYAAGQVWEYKTRPGDNGSLLKIQQIEDDPSFAHSGAIYHISIVGFHFANPRMKPVIPHSPVSRSTLDASVTNLSDSKVEFPDATAGIADWKNASGGIFTISVAQIVDLIDKQTAHVGE